MLVVEVSSRDNVMFVAEGVDFVKRRCNVCSLGCKFCQETLQCL